MEKPSPLPFKIPRLSPSAQPSPVQNHPTSASFHKQLIIAVILMLLAAGGYALLNIYTKNLGLSLLSLNQSDLIKLLITLLIQALIITPITLLTLFIRNSYLLILGITIPALLLILNFAYPITYALLLISILSNSGFAYQVKLDQSLFIKFNLSRLVIPHLSLILLSLALIITLPQYNFYQNNTDHLTTLITDQLIKPIISNSIKTDTTPSDLEQFTSEILPPNLRQFVDPETLLASLNQKQVTADQLVEAISIQINNYLNPYLRYLPILLTAITLLTVYQLSKFLSLFYIFCIWIGLKIFMGLGLVQIRTMPKPCDTLELT